VNQRHVVRFGAWYDDVIGVNTKSSVGIENFHRRLVLAILFEESLNVTADCLEVVATMHKGM